MLSHTKTSCRIYPTTGGLFSQCPLDGVQFKTPAKLYFLRTTDIGVQKLRSTLQNGQKDHLKQWKEQIQSINTIDLLKPDEKVLGFDNNWSTGTVECVLHPLSSDTEEEVQKFFELCGIESNSAQVRTYDTGITFISTNFSADVVEKAKQFNPLRAIHPIGNISIRPVRGLAGTMCPKVQKAQHKPTVNIGVFDGGVDSKIPLLEGYVTAIEGTMEPEKPEFVAHGSGVCSAILYGNLAGKTKDDILEAPSVSVACYRVLPLQNHSDSELYEAIDLIENIVPSDTKTRLYNLSFGPAGAIVDDSISRFTYVLDKLSYETSDGVDNPLFIVAVGNDGELPPTFNRIQAPSDIVNGLGVGAYTLDSNNEKIPAAYSCIGPGREGAKTKPDILDFGGSIDHPFIIPSTDKISLSATAGTSFAAPMVTGKIGRLLAMSAAISPHMGRTLLIHNANPNTTFPQICQGFGFCHDNPSDILECSDNSVTIMYNGEIMPTQFISLPIFAPRINGMQGKVKISWTVSVVVDPCSNDPDAYTNNCLEDVFCPHSMIFRFTKRGKKTVTLNLLDDKGMHSAKMLLNEGHKQSASPVSHPARKDWNEESLRATELKWDTVIHKSVSMRSQSLFNPTLSLHAIGRNGFDAHSIKYYVAISIDAPKYEGSLYDAVLQTYPNLMPIDIRSASRVMISDL